MIIIHISKQTTPYRDEIRKRKRRIEKISWSFRPNELRSTIGKLFLFLTKGI